jgi:hypothetical protein
VEADIKKQKSPFFVKRERHKGVEVEREWGGRDYREIQIVGV